MFFAYCDTFFLPSHTKGDFFMSTLNSRQSSAVKIKKLCIAALFCALAYATTFIFHFKVMFLSFDAKDAVVTLAGLLFGPIYSLSISITVALLEFITIGDTGYWGLLMDILSTATFSTVCALIYKYKKNIWGAMIGLVSSVFAMTAVMLVFNIFITPIYMKVDRSAVIALLPTLFLPFNLIKGMMNAAIVMVLYKPISRAVKAARILGPSASSGKPVDKKQQTIMSISIFAAGITLIAVSILIFIFVLNGSFVLW